MTNTNSIAGRTVLALMLIGLSAPTWSEDASDKWEKVVFHVDDTANARWALMLANAYVDDSPNASIVFVAYGPGVDFLLDDAEDSRGNPYDPAVLDLVGKGVAFRVCAGTLSARNIANEDVLDAAVIVPSGIAEIARLQLREGYAYLKP